QDSVAANSILDSWVRKSKGYSSGVCGRKRSIPLRRRAVCSASRHTARLRVVVTYVWRDGGRLGRWHGDSTGSRSPGGRCNNYCCVGRDLCRNCFCLEGPG